MYPKCNLITFVTELEEPYEGRLSRTVLWEGRGGIPPPDSINCNKYKMTNKIKGLLIVILIGKFSFAQTIEFSDSVFKKCLLDKELKIDLNNNGEIEIEEAEAVKRLEINNKAITNISEIKYFINIEELTCYDNKIDSLYLKDLPELKEINCRTNNMHFLKLENLNSLVELIAGQNKLSTVFIKDCPNLKVLYLQENELTNIDVTNLPLLEHLIIPNNQLTEIDISKNPELHQITVGYNKLSELDIRNNFKLEHIYVDDNVKKVMNAEQKKNSPFKNKPPVEMAPPPPGN